MPTPRLMPRPLPAPQGIPVMPPPVVEAPPALPPPVPEPAVAAAEYPEVAFERFRDGVAHIEIATTFGECLIIDESHPLFAEFQRWGSVWAELSPRLAPLRLHPEAGRRPGLAGAPRGRVRFIQQSPSGCR